jgi:hypothetical protein
MSGFLSVYRPPAPLNPATPLFFSFVFVGLNFCSSAAVAASPAAAPDSPGRGSQEKMSFFARGSRLEDELSLSLWVSLGLLIEG